MDINHDIMVNQLIDAKIHCERVFDQWENCNREWQSDQPCASSARRGASDCEGHNKGSEAHRCVRP